MKKVYTQSAIIANTIPGEFNDALAKRIDEFQKQGLQVEVQYKPVDTAYTALVLAYEEVDE